MRTRDGRSPGDIPSTALRKPRNRRGTSRWAASSIRLMYPRSPRHPRGHGRSVNAITSATKSQDLPTRNGRTFWCGRVAHQIRRRALLSILELAQQIMRADRPVTDRCSGLTIRSVSGTVEASARPGRGESASLVGTSRNRRRPDIRRWPDHRHRLRAAVAGKQPVRPAQDPRFRRSSAGPGAHRGVPGVKQMDRWAS